RAPFLPQSRRRAEGARPASGAPARRRLGLPASATRSGGVVSCRRAAASSSRASAARTSPGGAWASTRTPSEGGRQVRSGGLGDMVRLLPHCRPSLRAFLARQKGQSQEAAQETLLADQFA